MHYNNNKQPLYMNSSPVMTMCMQPDLVKPVRSRTVVEWNPHPKPRSQPRQKTNRAISPPRSYTKTKSIATSTHSRPPMSNRSKTSHNIAVQTARKNNKPYSRPIQDSYRPRQNRPKGHQMRDPINGRNIAPR